MPCRQFWTRSLGALLLVITASPAGALQSDALDARAFVAALEQLSTQIGAGEPGEVPSVRVPAVWTVSVDGQRYDVPAGWIQRTLDSARQDPSTWPAERSKLIARLAALRLEAHGLLDRDPVERTRPADGVARGALSRVLAQPEFRQMAQESAFARLRQRAYEWLTRWLERLAGGPLGRRGTAVALAWILSILVGIVLATLAVRAFLRPGRAFASLDDASIERGKPARAWARDALRAADAREAIRCAYRAVVAGIEEEGSWRASDSRTPREYERLLADGHRRRALFTDVARRFEEVWFAARTPTDADRSAVLMRLKELGCLPAD